MRYKIVFGYDGTNFHGWAKQPQLYTVQGVLEEALNRVLRLTMDNPIQLTVAGRTDVGVHAIGQTVHFDVDDDVRDRFSTNFLRRADEGTEWDPFAVKLAIKLNSIFSGEGDLRIQEIVAVPASFDARFSALWRIYDYRIADDQSFKDPRMRRHTVWHRGALDVEVLNAASAVLVGFQDFATFCKPRPGATTIRTLQEFSWTREADTGVLRGHIRADAFCHNMVRALIGAVVAVAEGRLSLEQLVVLRDQMERTSAFRVFPALGLTMVGVQYPDAAEYGARGLQTRARRS